MNEINWSEIKHFKPHEFECKCGCGLNNVDADLVYKLDEARGLVGVPFVLNRGCSCIKHNKKVGGEIDSSHLDGFAVDIKNFGSAHRFLVLKSLLAVGFNRIGVYKTFIHVDIDKTRSQKVIWYK